MKNQRTDNESRLKELRSKRMALIALAIALGGTPVLTAGCSNTQNVEKETEETKEQEKTLEETTNEIDKKYEELNEENLEEVLDRLLIPNYKISEYKILDTDITGATKLQEEFLNKLCRTVTKYHEQTHKENNFRLSEDGEYYLDFNIDVLLPLDLVINDYSQEELNELLGNYTYTKEELNACLKYMYLNLMVYYMTATEPSGISDLIKDENKKELFERIEEKVLNLNKDYSEENINDFLSEEIVQAVFNQDKEALEKMDFETLLSAIPVMAVAQRRFSDPLESKDITNTVNAAILVVTDEKTTKIEKAMPDVDKKYQEQLDKSNEIIEKYEEKEVKKLKKEVEEKFENIYGTELKEYMSEDDLNSYLIGFYENEVYTSNFGIPLSSVTGTIDYDFLEGKFGKIEDAATLHKIRLDLLLKELEGKKQSYNKTESEEKELAQAKVKTLKRHI